MTADLVGALIGIVAFVGSAAYLLLRKPPSKHGDRDNEPKTYWRH